MVSWYLKGMSSYAVCHTHIFWVPQDICLNITRRRQCFVRGRSYFSSTLTQRRYVLLSVRVNWKKFPKLKCHANISFEKKKKKKRNLHADRMIMHQPIVIPPPPPPPPPREWWGNVGHFFVFERCLSPKRWGIFSSCPTRGGGAQGGRFDQEYDVLRPHSVRPRGLFVRSVFCAKYFTVPFVQKKDRFNWLFCKILPNFWPHNVRDLSHGAGE